MLKLSSGIGWRVKEEKGKVKKGRVKKEKGKGKLKKRRKIRGDRIIIVDGKSLEVNFGNTKWIVLDF